MGGRGVIVALPDALLLKELDGVVVREIDGDVDAANEGARVSDRVDDDV